ncbi:hypothetical protein KY285_019518 [Solanum tuberosum]|nr:hypothetical protein KY285_019518 [Solanum tuberosum]
MVAKIGVSQYPENQENVDDHRFIQPLLYELSFHCSSATKEISCLRFRLLFLPCEILTLVGGMEWWSAYMDLSNPPHKE